jgi:small subunit ribosomal protein S20
VQVFDFIITLGIIVATHKSSEKRARQTIVKNARNRSYLSSVRTALKKFRAALSEGTDQKTVEGLFKAAQKHLDMAASKGLLHRNNAARNISRMTKNLRSYLSQAQSGATPTAAAKSSKKSGAPKKAAAPKTAKPVAAKAVKKTATKKAPAKKSK